MNTIRIYDNHAVRQLIPFNACFRERVARSVRGKRGESENAAPIAIDYPLHRGVAEIAFAVKQNKR